MPFSFSCACYKLYLTDYPKNKVTGTNHEVRKYLYNELNGVQGTIQLFYINLLNPTGYVMHQQI